MRKRIQNEGLVWCHSFMGHDDLRIIHIHSVVQRQDSDNDSSHYTEVIRGNYSVAAALSTILTALTVISLLIFMKVSKNGDSAM